MGEQTYAVAPAKLTKEIAISKYAQSLHTPLLFFTVVLRLLLGTFPSLKEHGLKEIHWRCLVLRSFARLTAVDGPEENGYEWGQERTWICL